jgi:hypothetical protein
VRLYFVALLEDHMELLIGIAIGAAFSKFWLAAYGVVADFVKSKLKK